MLKNFSIKTKMVLTTGTAVFVVSLLITIGLYMQGKMGSTLNHYSRVSIVRELKKNDVEEYFRNLKNQAITYAQDKMIVEAMEAFTHAFLNTSVSTQNSDYRAKEQGLYQYYRTNFLGSLIEKLDFQGESGQYIPQDPKSVLFQNAFLLNGDDEALTTLNSDYQKWTELYHPKISHYKEKFNLEDIYLIDNASGFVVYSNKKKADFATNILTGPWRDSNLARVSGMVRGANTKDQVGITDFGTYYPSFTPAVLFISVPVFNGNKNIGTLVFEVSPKEINSIMTGNKRWVTEGLQTKGETFIVGEDFKIKNDTRVLLEKPNTYYELLSKGGVDDKTIERIKKTGSSVQLQEIKYPVVSQALAGSSGNEIIEGYDGESYLVSYGPVEVEGLKWIMVSTFSEAEALYGINMVIVVIMIGTIVVILLAIAIAIPMGNSLAKPVIRLVGDLERISRGDLMVNVEVESSNEVGKTADALRRVTERLRHVIKDVIGAADNIAQASKEMNASSQQMSEGATEQASSAEEVSASMEEMAANIQQNTDNAKETENIAEQSSLEIIKGSEATEQTARSMKIIAEKISVIGEISRRTNLLALNAAVESVKKGVNGRGFSVVASEVRRLAEISQNAAIEIDKIAAECVDVAQKSGDYLKEIVPKVRRTADLVREITAASMEQNTGANQINSAIQHLNQIVQQNAATAEELAASSEELHSQADHLKDLVNFFNIGRNGLKEKEDKSKYIKLVEERKQNNYRSSKMYFSEDKYANNQNDNLDNEFEKF